MGRDSLAIPRDAYGYTLYYYGNGSTISDYTPIGGTNPFATTPPGFSSFSGLYNGNIAAIINNITKLTDPWHYYTYRYDQLNRIKASHVYKAGSTATSVADYHEAFTYDGNGNIKNVSRYAGAATVMDSLNYNYNTTNGRLSNNRLNYINDAVATHIWPYGLDNQAVNNYTYDAIGNMTADVTDTVSNVNWTVYDKIQNLTNSKGMITYTYDPAGQRTSKTLNSLTTYYIRDAQGNTLALYDNKSGNVNWREQELYGSSRLGMWQPNVNLSTNNAQAVWDTIGNKEYELNNHLGNVLATITDKRIQHASGATINYFDADVATAQEYYAFGGLMPQRTYTYTANNYYRYGFNGKENDNEVKGLGNQQDYGERIYDPRVGRFLSVDPITAKYPWLTPYQFASNNPVKLIDLDGKEGVEADAEPEETREESERERENEELHRALKFPTNEERERNARESENWFRRNKGRLTEALKELNDNLVENTENALGSQTATFKRQFEQFNANKANGQALESTVTQALAKRFNAGEVASQVTLQVSGKVNGNNVTVRIRIDNITNAGGFIDLHEAKYSVEQITGQNFNRTLTGNQQKAFAVFTQGTNVSIFVRGNNGREAGLNSGDNLIINTNTVNFNVVTNGQNGQPQNVSSTPIKKN